MDELFMEKHYTTSRGFTYRYYLSPANYSGASKATDPLLLFLHGWPDGAALWQFIVTHIFANTRCRMLAPDLLGYGGSSKPTDPQLFTSDLAAQDILEIIEASELSSLPLIPVGHDWGAFFAQRFYLHHSERCVGLVTLSVAYLPPEPEPFDLDATNAATEEAFGFPTFAYWELFTAPDGPELMTNRLESLWHVMHGDREGWTKSMFCERGTMRKWLEADRRDVPLKKYAQNEKLRGEWIRSMREGGLRAPCCSYRVVKENFQTEVERTLPTKKIEKPYLFIGGDSDPVCRTDMIQQPIEEGLLSDVTVREVSSGHWMPYEKPDEVGAIMVDWLKEKYFT